MFHHGNALFIGNDEVIQQRYTAFAQEQFQFDSAVDVTAGWAGIVSRVFMRHNDLPDFGTAENFAGKFPVIQTQSLLISFYQHFIQQTELIIQ